jgi:tetrapyrrole methylase family protein/MazG family protein
MPQLFLFGLDPAGAISDEVLTVVDSLGSARLLAGNPGHTLVVQHFGRQVLEANEARVQSLFGSQVDGVYVSVGHPLMDDGKARVLSQQAVAAGWEVRVFSAPSLLERAYAAFAPGYEPINVVSGFDSTLKVGESAQIVIASNMTHGALRKLVRDYPGTQEVGMLVLNGQTPEAAQTLTLIEALAWNPDILYFAPLAPLERLDSPDALRWIMARLRAPDGCPWDQEQTHRTLKKHLLEETAEVIDALDEEDMPALREELGDLLLQVYFQAQLAEEQGDFTFDDVVRGISEKLVRRHPHVFGDRAVGSAEQALANWEEIKQEEHAARGKERHSILDRVPQSLSGLSTAQAIGNTVAKVGFDWPAVEGVLEKLREEIDELVAADNVEHRFEELGDVLFVLAQVAKWLEVDAEEALRASNAKFRRRFAYMEEVARHEGCDLSDYPFKKLDALWEEAKLATSNPWGCPR